MTTIVMNFKTIVMQKLFRIYSLINPITNEVGYVGATSLLLNIRHSQHKHNALTKKLKTNVSKWFRSVVEQGTFPKIEHLESCTKNDWAEKEIYWINNFNELSNTRKGGTGIVLNRTSESKQRSINAHKKPIVILDKQFNFLQDFDSCKDCANYLNRGIAAICNSLNPKGNNSIAGYIILFKEDFISGNYEKKYKGVYKDVFQYSLEGNFIQKFYTVNEAFNIVKPAKYVSSLFEAIKSKGKCGNYFWSSEEITNFDPYKAKLKFSHKKQL